MLDHQNSFFQQDNQPCLHYSDWLSEEWINICFRNTKFSSQNNDLLHQAALFYGTLLKFLSSFDRLQIY